MLSGTDILALQELVRKVPIADHVSRYAVRLTRSTRRDEANDLNFVRDYVSWGAGPRASQYLVLAAKARAVLHGSYHVSTDDIRAGRRAGTAASDHHQFQRRSRGPQARRHRRAADQVGSRRRARGRAKWKTTKNI